jgi:uncharacterized protein (DUF362 family)/Pyruvate/2-oxoacid:ferredoxin oxidoreductase delta subunit
MISKDSTVSLVRCDGYGRGEIEQAVGRALGLLGGLETFVKPGDRVLLKPNLLSARTPDRCVTTDPGLVREVARLVQQAGGKPFIGDSPALGSFKRVAGKTGMAETARELGIEIAELTNPTPVSLPAGSLHKALEIASAALEADVIINLPKLKTHSQMLLTLGVKNLFGTVVAQRKAEWHYMTGVNRDSFASLHLDILLALKPALTVMDGVWGMEGHGPANGEPRHLRMIAAGRDPVALDVLICSTLGIPLRLFPLYREARKRGIGEIDPSRIPVKGDAPQSFRIRDFRIPELDSLGILPGVFEGPAKRYLVSRPVQDGGACAGCGECEQICHAAAIQRDGKSIAFDYDRCIRCYCCQEVCPEDAIRFKKGLLVRLLNRFNR